MKKIFLIILIFIFSKAVAYSEEMDDEQSDRAMRESMATFADNIAPMPKVKGFMANFAQVGRALSPAIHTHDQYEDEAKEKNKQMIAYAQQLRAAEEAKAAALEGNAYSREMADKQYGLEQKKVVRDKVHKVKATKVKTGKVKDVHVKGYYRRNGTYVRSHYRSK